MLVYLVNHGYSEEIRAWHRAHPEVALHCFYDRPGAPPEEVVDGSLTFHRLDGEKFLRMMAGCRAVVSTAGFESVCEAAWLGKPVLVVPGPEPRRADAECAGCGPGRVRASPTSTFRLDRLRGTPRSTRQQPLPRLGQPG